MHSQQIKFKTTTATTTKAWSKLASKPVQPETLGL
jgi:hypothetical protein